MRSREVSLTVEQSCFQSTFHLFAEEEKSSPNVNRHKQN